MGWISPWIYGSVLMLSVLGQIHSAVLIRYTAPHGPPAVRPVCVCSHTVLALVFTYTHTHTHTVLALVFTHTHTHTQPLAETAHHTHTPHTATVRALIHTHPHTPTPPPKRKKTLFPPFSAI